MRFKYLLIPGLVFSPNSYGMIQISFGDLVKKYALQQEDCKEGTEEVLFSEERIILRVRSFGDYLDYKARRLDRCCQSCGETNHAFFIPNGMWKCRTCGNEWKRKVR